MTSRCWIVYTFAILTTGAGLALDVPEPNQEVRLEVGQTLPISVRSDSSIDCKLITPQNNTIEFAPEDHSNEKFKRLDPIHLFNCRAEIRNLNEDDNGIWQLTSTSEDGMTASQYYKVVVDSKDTTLAGNKIRDLLLTKDVENKSEENMNSSDSENKSEEDMDPSNEMQTARIQAGQNFPMSVRTNLDEVAECKLIKPNNETIEVLPNDQLNRKFQRMEPIFLFGCRVQILNIDEEDSGVWKLYYVSENGNKGSQLYNILVEPPPPPEITTFNTIRYGASIGDQISISLSRRSFTEDCYLKNHLGDITNLDHEDPFVLVGTFIKTFTNQTSFVSCQVAIGPIQESMLGTWTLCGARIEGGIRRERCQPGNIFLANNANNQYNSSMNTLNAIERIVQFGQPLTAEVRGFGGLLTCNVITPNGDNIVVTATSDYPGLTFIEVGDTVTCRIEFNPTNADFLGRWILYGTYNSNTVGFNVVRLPISFFLAGGEPDQDSGITHLTPINYKARRGSKVTIALSKTDFTEECYLTTPGGQTINLKSEKHNGVTAFVEATSFVSCRAVIGPMDESLLGTWMLCGTHKTDGVERRRCQQGTLAWGQDDPDSDFHTRDFPYFDYPVNFGRSQALSVRGTGSLNTCHVVTPNGEDLVVTSTTNYPGLTSVTPAGDTTLCSVIFDITSHNFLGKWELYGTYNSNTLGFNIARLPFTFFLFDEEHPYNQAYNVTNLDPAVHVINLGNIVTSRLSGSDTRENCLFMTNTGERHDFATVNSVEGVSLSSSSSGECRITVGPVSKNMLGNWSLIGRFRRNGMFNERRLPFTIVMEDPANPIPDDSRTIEISPNEDIYTELGAVHNMFTTTGRDETTDSCHLRTPDNLQFRLIDGFNVSGVEIDRRSNIACGVYINVKSIDMLGDWMLISRINGRNGLQVERRLPFTIHVEEYVEGWPNKVTVAEGNNIHVRLNNPSLQPSTCALEGPSENIGEVDQAFVDYCGFIVRNLSRADNGQWNVTYGTGIIYKAFIEVEIIARIENLDQTYVWNKGEFLDEVIGPEDAVYCRIENPQGLVVTEGFDQCRIVLARVTEHHEGTWKMTIGTPGRVTTDTFEFVVQVTKPSPKAEVVTSVETTKPDVMLSCQVETDHAVTGCKFRDPSGRVLLAHQGVGEERYTFHGTGVSMAAEVSQHQCGLRITNPVVGDLGLWRCAVETEEDIYYGFLRVLCSFALSDPATAGVVVTEPTLRADTEVRVAVEGDDVIMHCSVQSALRYCYFRRHNGTVYNVSPGVTGDFEYVGAGLDAGECGIRFKGLQTADSGNWSCHVGFPHPARQEQRAEVQLIVKAMMTATQHFNSRSGVLVLEAWVNRYSGLDYCRFVRMDGLGFTSDTVPPGYEDHGDLLYGRCRIHVNNPSMLDHHPWTIAARIVGQDVEISRTTNHTIQLPVIILPNSTGFIVAWSCVLLISLAIFFIGMMLGPKKNREWTYQHAAAVRSSIRTSFRKPRLEAENGPVTSMAA